MFRAFRVLFPYQITTIWGDLGWGADCLEWSVDCSQISQDQAFEGPPFWAPSFDGNRRNENPAERGESWLILTCNNGSFGSKYLENLGTGTNIMNRSISKKIHMFHVDWFYELMCGAVLKTVSSCCASIGGKLQKHAVSSLFHPTGGTPKRPLVTTRNCSCSSYWISRVVQLVRKLNHEEFKMKRCLFVCSHSQHVPTKQ